MSADEDDDDDDAAIHVLPSSGPTRPSGFYAVMKGGDRCDAYACGDDEAAEAEDRESGDRRR